MKPGVDLRYPQDFIGQSAGLMDAKEECTLLHKVGLARITFIAFGLLVVSLFASCSDATAAQGFSLQPVRDINSDWFGGTLSLTGEWLAVSASNAGTVHLYAVPALRQGTSAKFQQLPGGTEGRKAMGFGRAMCWPNPDSLIIGSSQEPRVLGDTIRTGKIYVYHWREDGGAFTLTGEVDPPDPEMTCFGASLATNGDWLFIGAKEVIATTGALRGVVCIYKFGTSGWQFVETISGTEDFGNALATSGKRLAVGIAPFDVDRPGEVRLYECDSTGNWAYVNKRSNPDPARSRFGMPVALRGDSLFIGRMGVSGQTDSGSVLAYQGVRQSWQLRNEMEGSSAFPNAFGAAIALSSDVAIIGSNHWNTGSPAQGLLLRRESNDEAWIGRSVYAGDTEVLGDVALFGELLALSTPMDRTVWIAEIDRSIPEVSIGRQNFDDAVVGSPFAAACSVIAWGSQPLPTDSVAVATIKPAWLDVTMSPGRGAILLEGIPGPDDHGEACIVVRVETAQGLVLGERSCLITVAASSAPEIVIPPLDSATFAGRKLTLRVDAKGPELNYSWHRNGQLLDDQTGDIYVIASLGEADEGSYTVAVSNATGSVESAPAMVSVIEPRHVTDVIVPEDYGTIEDALKAVSSQTTVYLQPGTYRLGELSAENFVSLKGVGGPERTAIKTEAGGGLIASSGVRLEGIQFTGTRGVSASQAAEIITCKFFNCHDPLNISGAEVMVSGNRYKDCTSPVRLDSVYGLVTNNVFDKSPLVYSRPSVPRDGHLTIANNTFYLSYFTVAVGSAAQATELRLINNVLWDLGATNPVGVGLSSDANLVAVDADVHSHMGQFFTTAATNFRGSPGFRNAPAGDFRLAPVSAAIDRGIADLSSGDYDASGNARTVGEAVDIGAFEYDPATYSEPDFSVSPQFISGLEIRKGYASTAFEVSIRVPEGVPWTIEESTTWLSISPVSGIGSSTVRVEFRGTSAPDGTNLAEFTVVAESLGSLSVPASYSVATLGEGPWSNGLTSAFSYLGTPVGICKVNNSTEKIEDVFRLPGCNSVALTRDGRQVLACKGLGGLHLYDADTGAETLLDRELPPGITNAVAIDESLVVGIFSTTEGQSLQVFSIPEGEILSTQNVVDPNQSLMAIGATPDAGDLIVGFRQPARLVHYRYSEGRLNEIKTSPAFRESRFRPLFVSENGHIAFQGLAFDDQLQPRSERPIDELLVAQSRFGGLFATETGVYRADNGQRIYRFPGNRRSAVFTQDGQSLLTVNLATGLIEAIPMAKVLPSADLADLTVTGVARSADGNLELRFTGPVGYRMSVMATEDFIHWREVSSPVLIGVGDLPVWTGMFDGQQRFFRIVPWK
ncbi:MAG: choice-of-anchor Q domain-containing protein [Verrucomicrobiales bacterium]